MRPYRPLGQIHPKISTMPRQKSDAATYLEIYKLVVERKRLQDELQRMELRRQQIQKRLGQVESQVAELEKQIPSDSPQPAKPEAIASAPPTQDFKAPQSKDFKTVFLDY